MFFFLGNGDKSWCFSQIKGALDDDVTDADIISCVEFNHDGELLATGDKGGRVVIFQVSNFFFAIKLNEKFIIFFYLNREIKPLKQPYLNVENTMFIQHFNHMNQNSII